MALDENFVLDRIEELCKRKNYSHYKLAQKAGIHQASLSTLLNRGSTPNVYTLSKICDGFDISLSQFFASGYKHARLSDKQKEMLEKFDELTDVEQELVKAYMQGLTETRKLKQK